MNGLYKIIECICWTSIAITFIISCSNFLTTGIDNDNKNFVDTVKVTIIK